MSEKMKAVTRRIFEEVWAGDLDVVDEVFTDNYVAHGLAPGLPPGPEGFKVFVSMYLSAFPDVHFTIEDQVAQKNNVVTRWTARGTHQGELMGIPASGKAVTVEGISFNRFEGDRSAESWNSWDGLGMLQQIGAIPVMGEPA